MKRAPYWITIDMGTTNTRMLLLNEDNHPVARGTAQIGVRNTAVDGHNRQITAAVRDGIASLMKSAEIGLDEVSIILASGMITSNMGLFEIPHLPAPVGLDDLARAVRPVTLPDICDKPIHFIPGVKNAVPVVDIDHFSQMDMMRGEEVECFGLLADYPAGREYLLVLPGSHTKFVSVDSLGRIAGCMTTLSGELLDAVTRHTLIADTVGGQFAQSETYDREMALRGFSLARQSGFSRTAFSARVLGQFKAATPEQIASFLLGAIVAEDIGAIGSMPQAQNRHTTVIVAGKAPLQQAFMDALHQEGYFEQVLAARAPGALALSARGAGMVAQRL